MSKRERFSELVCSAAKAEILRKLVFSRPTEGEIVKVTARLVAHRGRRALALEYSLPGNTVSHKNLGENEMFSEVSHLLLSYKQANLLTTAGDAEWKISSSGKEALLGADKLERQLSADSRGFESAIERESMVTN